MSILLPIIECAALAVMCGVGNRVRGGLWGTQLGLGDMGARVLGWGIPSAITAGVAFGHGLQGAAMGLGVGVMAWVGCSAGLFNSLGIGDGAGSLAAKWLGLTAFSFLRMLGVAVLLAVWWLSWAHIIVSTYGEGPYPFWWLALVPLLGPALYWLSWHQPLTIWWLRITPGPAGNGVQPFQGPTFGEFTWGILAGVALFAAAGGFQ